MALLRTRLAPSLATGKAKLKVAAIYPVPYERSG